MCYLSNIKWPRILVSGSPVLMCVDNDGFDSLGLDIKVCLIQAGCSRLIRNFSDDIRDSEIYSELLAQVAPKDSHISKDYMSKEDWLERAEMMLSTADSINCRAFVTAKVNL